MQLRQRLLAHQPGGGVGLGGGVGEEGPHQLADAGIAALAQDVHRRGALVGRALLEGGHEQRIDLAAVDRQLADAAQDFLLQHRLVGERQVVEQYLGRTGRLPQGQQAHHLGDRLGRCLGADLLDALLGPLEDFQRGALERLFQEGQGGAAELLECRSGLLAHGIRIAVQLADQLLDLLAGFVVERAGLEVIQQRFVVGGDLGDLQDLLLLLADLRGRLLGRLGGQGAGRGARQEQARGKEASAERHGRGLRAVLRARGGNHTRINGRQGKN